ncbi:hypothetical protein DPSP01_014449, partial [Paraphaeosphaeria sporulosa]
LAVQSFLDRFYSGYGMSREYSSTTGNDNNPFLTEQNLETQEFTTLHHVVLKISELDLSHALKIYPGLVDKKDRNGRTPLLWAAWRGDLHQVKLLLEATANVNQKDCEGYTPLGKACQAGHLNIVKCLIDAGASVRISTRWGDLAIHLASANKESGNAIVKLLLDKNADANAHSRAGTPLHSACNNGSLKTVDTLIAAGAELDMLDEQGLTPAMVALCCWNEPAFLHLAERGAGLHYRSQDGWNIVQLVIWTGTPKSWRFLIKVAGPKVMQGVHTEMLHEGHGLDYCFENCRNYFYQGPERDLDEEKMVFSEMRAHFTQQKE